MKVHSAIVPPLKASSRTYYIGNTLKTRRSNRTKTSAVLNFAACSRGREVWPSGTTYVEFNDVVVPAENLIGEENKGFAVRFGSGGPRGWRMC